MRGVTAMGVALALLHCTGCITQSTLEQTRRALAGRWRFTGAIENPYPFPAPALLVLGEDGGLTASWAEPDVAELQRAIAPRPVSGCTTGSYELHEHMARDFFLPRIWISMTCGAPYRLFHVDRAQLVLHRLGSSWPEWRYEREE